MLSLSSVTGCLNDHLERAGRMLPLTPALENNSCSVDYKLLAKRALVLGAATLASMAVASVVSVLAGSTAPVVVVGFSAIIVFASVTSCDRWIAESAADVKAVNQYLNTPCPTQSATFRIQHRVSAARLLVRHNVDLNRKDEKGERLLDYMPDFEILKILVDHGADLRLKNKWGQTPFEKLIDSTGNGFYLNGSKESSLALLAHVLKSHFVKPSDFTQEEIRKIWSLVKDESTALLLGRYGF